MEIEYLFPAWESDFIQTWWWVLGMAIILFLINGISTHLMIFLKLSIESVNFPLPGRGI